MKIMNKLGLLGKRLDYSLSKVIHEEIYKENNLNFNYELIEKNEDELVSFFKELKVHYSGINVTIPYKEKVLKYLDYLDDKAKELGNVNTICVKNDKLYGYNTDYIGFKLALEYYKIEVLNKNVLILGTGGASKTAFHVLKDMGAKNILFVSRNKKGTNVISYLNVRKHEYDLVINATPVGTKGDDSSPLTKEALANKVVFDMVYNPLQTPFLKLANSYNNGLIMLIYQAYFADCLFLDKKLKLDLDKILKKVGAILE